MVNSLDQECFEIVKAPKKCPRGESNPEINFWVKGDGCCEVKKEESELCDPPVDDDKAKTTTQKMTTKRTTRKTTRKPSPNDVDSGLPEF